MRVTVVGNPSRYLAPYSGGSGYLVEAGGKCLLLDCGQGVLAALASRGAPPLDAVCVTHFHFDHCLDLPPLLNSVRPRPVALLVPASSRDSLDAMAGAYRFQGPFDTPGPLHALEEGDSVDLGDGVRVLAGPLTHSAPGVSLRVEHAGRALAYLSDTAPSPALARFARGADVVLAHTLLPDVAPDSDHARVHMTARAAGRFATAAGARELWLSHRYWESPDAAMTAAATEGFDRAIRLLNEGDLLDV